MEKENNCIITKREFLRIQFLVKDGNSKHKKKIVDVYDGDTPLPTDIVKLKILSFGANLRSNFGDIDIIKKKRKDYDEALAKAILDLNYNSMTQFGNKTHKIKQLGNPKTMNR